MSKRPDSPGKFFVQTVYGATTREPMVSISYNGRELCKISPQDTVALGLNLLQAATASVTDAFLFEFIKENVGGDDAGGQMLMEFRRWREKRNYDLGDDFIKRR